MQAGSIRVDAVGELCPVPITRTAEAISALAAGAILELLADDPMTVVDLRCWADCWGHDYLGHEIRGEVLHLFVRKAGRGAA
jgi:TusA-related sulfurtransferase